MKNNQNGFTLIEILVTCVIISLLAAFAIPSYQNYAMRGHRVQAQADLVEYAHQAERIRTANGTYAEYELPKSVSPRAGEPRYDLEISGGDDDFKIIAKPKGSQEKDDCGELSINQAGQKTSSGESTKCW